MTAFNIIAQPDAAYIINDTAAYNRDSTILGFRMKTVELTASMMEPAALCSMGALHADDLVAIICAMNLSAASNVLEALPEILERAISIVRERDMDPIEDGVAIGMASYDVRARKASGHVIASYPEFGGTNADYVPGTVVGGCLGHYVTVDWQKEFGADHRFSDPARFDPYADGLRLLEAQRHTPNERFPIVGGHAMVTKVDVTGVQTRMVHVWPDTVGEKVSLAAARQPTA